MHAYMDNSATTRPLPEVVDYISEMMTLHYGNPSSMHRLGVDAELKIKGIKNQILRTLGNPDGDIIFTSGGTESNNIALLGLSSMIKRRKPHIITTKTEHKSVLAPIKHLEDQGFEVTYLNVDPLGRVSVESVLEAIRPETGLVSIMAVNNETGTVQPIDAIGKAIKKLKEPPIFHVDGVQVFGKMRLDVNKANIDLFTASGHKVHGPKGIGFLFVKKGVRLKGIVMGGGQQFDIRPGTENTYGIYGLSKAIEILFKDLEGVENHLRQLKSTFTEGIHNNIPNAICHSELEDAPHIVSMSFPGIRGEVLLHALESVGIFVSTGSACNSKNKQYSHVLTAMKIRESLMESTIRFSFSIMTTLEEVNYTVEQVQIQYEKLYQMTKGR